MYLIILLYNKYKYRTCKNPNIFIIISMPQPEIKHDIGYLSFLTFFGSFFGIIKLEGTKQNKNPTPYKKGIKLWVKGEVSQIFDEGIRSKYH